MTERELKILIITCLNKPNIAATIKCAAGEDNRGWLSKFIEYITNPIADRLEEQIKERHPVLNYIGQFTPATALIGALGGGLLGHYLGRNEESGRSPHLISGLLLGGLLGGFAPVFFSSSK